MAQIQHHKSNVILIGMPASGKSTIGVVLAKIMSKSFVDTDITIQQVEGRTLQEIIDSRGNEYFGQVEEQVLLDFDQENCVVATGGSAVYYEKAINKFKEKGVVVYLKVSPEGIHSRLHNLATRGVTLKPGQTIDDLYWERVPLYEEACDIEVTAENADIWSIAESIAEKIQSMC